MPAATDTSPPPAGSCPIDEFLAACCAVVRQRGYARAGSVAKGLETWRLAEGVVHNARCHGMPLTGLPTVGDEDREAAGRIISHVMSMGPPCGIHSNYHRGLATIIRGGSVSDLTKGLVASAVPAFQHEPGRRAAA